MHFMSASVSVSVLYFEAEGEQLEHGLDGEEAGEDDVEVLEHGLDALRLVVPLHHEYERVERDEQQYEVLEGGRDDQLPDLVAQRVLVVGHEALERLGVDGEVHARLLVLVDLALGELLLALLLERDDDQRHEDVHEEERKHDEVEDVEERHRLTVARHRAKVGLGRIDRVLGNTIQQEMQKYVLFVK